MRKLAGLVSLALLAGPAWAGDAWIADYVVGDASGDKSLVVVRNDDQVEYRMQGEAPRLWRKTADGLEMRELHPDEKRMITYSPGDLRTLGMSMDWNELAGVVAPATREALVAKQGRRQFGMDAVRYSGNDAHGNPVVIDWLPEAGLPAHFASGKAKGKDASATQRDLRLRNLERKPSAQAFSATDDLLEIDQADLGDMEMNPEIRRLTQGSHSH